MSNNDGDAATKATGKQVAVEIDISRSEAYVYARLNDGRDIYLERGDGQFESVKAALSEMVDKLAAVVTVAGATAAA